MLAFWRQEVVALETEAWYNCKGFPRADIDVHAARSDRHRVAGKAAPCFAEACLATANTRGWLSAVLVAVLSNDHKAVTGRIEALLADLHAQSRQTT